jgi:hypothetical protein
MSPLKRMALLGALRQCKTAKGPDYTGISVTRR